MHQCHIHIVSGQNIEIYLQSWIQLKTDESFNPVPNPFKGYTKPHREHCCNALYKVPLWIVVPVKLRQNLCVQSLEWVAWIWTQQPAESSYPPEGRKEKTKGENTCTQKHKAGNLGDGPVLYFPFLEKGFMSKMTDKKRKGAVKFQNKVVLDMAFGYFTKDSAIRYLVLVCFGKLQ